MNVQLGTSLPVATTADQFPVFVAGMDDPIKPVQDKLTPDGRVKYSTGALLRVARKDGTVATDKTASVHVINPPNEPFSFGTIYRAEGLVWVQPYMTGMDRLALSITVENLVPMPVAAVSAPVRKSADA
ncbi:TPA: hypothetical protein ACL38W_002017 [Streptococcus pneumoniae]